MLYVSLASLQFNAPLEVVHLDAFLWICSLGESETVSPNATHFDRAALSIVIMIRDPAGLKKAL